MKLGLKARDKRGGGNMNSSAVASNRKHTACYKWSCFFARPDLQTFILLLQLLCPKAPADLRRPRRPRSLLEKTLCHCIRISYSYYDESLLCTGLLDKWCLIWKIAVCCLIAGLLLCCPQHYSFGTMPSTHLCNIVVSDYVRFLVGWWDCGRSQRSNHSVATGTLNPLSWKELFCVCEELGGPLLFLLPFPKP